MSEAQLQRRIQRAIAERGGKCYKLHGNVFGVAGQPDLIGTLNGVPFVLEVKLHTREATPKQQHELDGWRAQGWRAAVVTTVKEALEAITCEQSRGLVRSIGRSTLYYSGAPTSHLARCVSRSGAPGRSRLPCLNM